MKLSGKEKTQVLDKAWGDIEGLGLDRYQFAEFIKLEKSHDGELMIQVWFVHFLGTILSWKMPVVNWSEGQGITTSKSSLQILRAYDDNPFITHQNSPYCFKKRLQKHRIIS